jgi:hypothetical protein
MQFIVCEQAGDWTHSLRRWLPDVSVFETRILFEIWDRLETDQTSIVGIEFSTAKADAILAAIVRINRNFPRSRCIVLLPRALRAWDLAVREAGAIHVVYSPRDLRPLGQLLRRHELNRPPVDATTRETPHSLEAQILASLPWSE